MLKSWYVYILECSDGTYYTGITNDLMKRIDTHNKGKGAKYTRGRLPVTLVWSEEVEDRSAALQKEIKIKKMSREEKKSISK